MRSKPSEPRLPDTPMPVALRHPWHVLVLGAVVPLTIAVLLYRWDVPLGCPGRFVYPYSPLVDRRIGPACLAVLIGLLLGGGTWLVAASSVAGRRGGFAAVVLGVVALAAWSYFAPPDHYNQYVFNAHSPSQDGAFVEEAGRVQSVRAYLADFPARARTPPEQMRGTRVVSNPPGATLLAIALDGLLQRWPGLEEFLTRPLRAAMSPDAAFDQVRSTTARGLVFFGVLTALWALAAAPLYLAARLLLPPATAVAFVLCSVFTPATLLLTPGKDPAQLLSVGMPLLFWLLAWRRGYAWAAVLAGTTFVLACLVSLVHVWIGGITLVSTLLATFGSWTELRRVILRAVVPASVSVVVTGVALYLLCGLDLIATFRAVAHSQAEVTRGPNAMPLVWQLLGLPLFLLFAGPALWTAVGWAFARRPAPSDPLDAGARFGRSLVLLTTIVLLATVAFTNSETPRLWIPFAPLLLLGLSLQIAPLRGTTRGGVFLLAVLVCVQIACAAAQWSLMDMRETETRLLDGRFYH